MRKLCIVLCVTFIVSLGMLASAEEAQPEKEEKRGRSMKKSAYVASLEVYGEIDASSYTYDHYGMLDEIDALTWDKDNIGLILLLDTPGGSVYEMDELYNALMNYRAETGRPVYAYMERECCSAGVYIAMAAQRIAASRMSLTGSVGVYLEESSDAGMLEKLGIHTEYIVTGENKLTAPGGPTDEQRAILQEIVDESFGYFIEAIANARGEEVARNEKLLDGRLLTATQAKEMGLIDEVLFYDEAIDWFYELGDFGDVELVDVTPSWYDEEDLSNMWNENETDTNSVNENVLNIIRNIFDFSE